jgi:hypothetical protein
MTAPADVLATIRRHADSHRAMAETDAYSAQEAPRLEAALAAVAELIEARATLEESTTMLRAVSVELRTRKINHGRNTSPTLTAWAARIDAALDHLEGR